MKLIYATLIYKTQMKKTNIYLNLYESLYQRRHYTKRFAQFHQM